MVKYEVFSCDEFSIFMIKENNIECAGKLASYPPLDDVILKSNLKDESVELLYLTKIEKIPVKKEEKSLKDKLNTVSAIKKNEVLEASEYELLKDFMASCAIKGKVSTGIFNIQEKCPLLYESGKLWKLLRLDDISVYGSYNMYELRWE